MEGAHQEAPAPELLKALEAGARSARLPRATREDILRLVVEIAEPRVGRGLLARWLAGAPHKRALCHAVEQGLQRANVPIEPSAYPSLDTDVALASQAWGEGILVHTEGLTDFGVPEVGAVARPGDVDAALDRLLSAYKGVLSNPSLSWAAWVEGRTAEVDDGTVLVPLNVLKKPLLVALPDATESDGLAQA